MQAIPCKDHLGNEFPSINAMCKHYGIDRNVFDYRIYEKHIPLKDALTKPTRKKHNGSCKDHLGNEFPNKQAMCEHYDISTDTFNKRRNEKHMSLKDALTTPVKKNHNGVCKDHLGNEFPNIMAMCKHYHITKDSFNKRIKNNWTLKDALTVPIKKRNKSCKDHLGNTFPSVTAMCKHYNITKDVFNDRTEKGWSLKDALTTPVQKHNKSCTDHLGNTFLSIKDMCKHYHIKYHTFKRRIDEQHMSLKDALTTPLETKHSCPCKDHLGNEFPSMSAMCKHYGVNIDTFKGRIENNSSIEEALGVIPFICFRTKNTRITDNLFIKEVKAIRKKMLYAVCIYNDTETLLTHDEIIEIYRNETRNAP